MSLPTPSDVHTNATLSDMSVMYQDELTDYQADALAPIHPSPKQSDLFYKFTKDYWFRDAMQLTGPGAAAPRAGYGVETDSFHCNVWTVAKAIADQTRANEDNPLNSDRNAMQFVTRLERIRREKSFAAACMATSKWTTDITCNDSASVPGTSICQFNDSDATPLEDITYYRTYMKLLTGQNANVLALGRQAWDALRNNADILERISGGSNNGNPALVTREIVAKLCDLEEIVVLDAVENTAAEGATFAGAFIAAQSGLLMHRNKSAGVESVTAVKTFCWQTYSQSPNGTRILKFRDENVHSDIVECHSAFAHKIVAPDLGIFFADLVK